ncbi:hypothetical protein RchiOBHm_Chr4g0392811 [Rosa chinensis]|uniref:Uncharacterized protein n=1 Tax=Rosa chinensis TaxID=74649 RepID=A0A2P6QQW8_ROSCH|nr:hypothetical protein RchiOBHm_Chr4g0392811 [Rosa chinensis]
MGQFCLRFGVLAGINDEVAIHFIAEKLLWQFLPLRNCLITSLCLSEWINLNNHTCLNSNSKTDCINKTIFDYKLYYIL